MNEIFSYLQSAITGPGRFRFVVQPLVAILLGIRDGRIDVRLGLPAYGLQVVRAGLGRSRILKQGVRQIIVPLCIGFLLDVIIRAIMGYGFRPVASALVGIFLIGLPYILARGITNRVTARQPGRT
jgi:hypothetical protein